MITDYRFEEGETLGAGRTVTPRLLWLFTRDSALREQLGIA